MFIRGDVTPSTGRKTKGRPMTEICARCHGIGGVLSQSTGRMISTCYACGGMGEIEVDE